MPTIDIDGRGKTPKEAVQDMWARMIPLEEDGYHAITSVEIVDVKGKKIMETFEVTDPEWRVLRPTPQKKTAKDVLMEEHKPPARHDFRFVARVRLEQ